MSEAPVPLSALALDLDGTLLVGEDLSPGNRDAVRAAVDAGWQVIIATARWKELALRIGAEIGLDGPVIACSGAQVYDPASGSDLWAQRLPVDFTEALYALCNSQRCIATVTVGNEVLLKLDGEPDPSLLGEEMRWVRQLEVDPADPPRIAAIQGSQACARIKAELQPAWGDRVNVFDSIGPTGKLVLTITNKAATKGAALTAACSHLGLHPGSVVAFGDAENDLAMFAVAGASVAMGQADADLKAAAHFTTLANTDDGVAHAIHMLLRDGRLPGG